MGFVFYDTETTGTDTFFDQIVQFAAIRTDEEVNEVDRLDARCRLLPHVVPSPNAIRVNGLRVSQLTDRSLPSHYEMVRMTRDKLLSWSPAVFVGWNSIRFDELLLRQALYMTLHDPYLTSREGNSRSDAMRLAQACRIFVPTAITFPTDHGGRSVFRLDAVARANGFEFTRAHDAMGDVEATVFICRLLRANAPEVRSSFMRFSSKAGVSDYLSQEPMFCFCDYYREPFSCIATAIGQSGSNPADWYAYNLCVEPETLLALSDDELSNRLSELPRPVRILKSNGAPMLFPVDQAPEWCAGRELGMEELDRRVQLLQSDSALRQRLIASLESSKAAYPRSLHVEKQIYDGFPEEPDEQLMEAFHEADWTDRLPLVEAFQDQRLRQIGRRLIYLERPDLLDAPTRREHQVAHNNRLLGVGDEVTWLTLPRVLTDLQNLLTTASGPELELLREHYAYLRSRHDQALQPV
jgi:exodeoxyribonuclease-1